MAAHMQNPGLAPRVSCIRLGHFSFFDPIASHWRAQMPASRFCLSPWTVRLWFGEGRDD